MDNNKENDLQDNIPEENIEKEQPQDAQQAPADDNANAKNFWKEKLISAGPIYPFIICIVLKKKKANI